MGRISFILVAFIVLVSSASTADVWYIKDDGTGDAPHIQAGIDSSVVGDTVLVAPGIFTGNGNWDISVIGKSIVIVAERIVSPSVSDTTFIDCAGSHIGFHFSAEPCNSILDGFVIENGGTGGYSSKGGGIFCDSLSCPTIRNNTIRDCVAWLGGGIYCYFSSPIIDSNDIYDNENNGFGAFGGGGGAGIYCYESSAIIINNSIHHNCAYCGGHDGSPGGGIYCKSCSLITIKNNEIHNNAAYYDGGGIYLRYSTGSIDSNFISSNWLTYDGSSGGGISARSCSLSIIGNDIAENRVQYGGGGGIFCDSSIVDIAFNFIDDNGCFGNCFGGGGLELQNSTTITVRSNTIVSNNSGGIRCSSCSPHIEDNIIISNYTSLIGGGGINCASASPMITNNTIVANTAFHGGGIYCDSGSSAVINNNIVAFNNRQYPFEGGGIYIESPSVIISCCNVYDNDGGNYYGTSDTTGVNGNISVDPLFCDLYSDNYYLRSDSPCLPGSHPYGNDCGLIGALSLGCAIEEPYLSQIEDILNDQGRQVSISWYRNMWDSVGSSQPILSYEVYRRIDELPTPPISGITSFDDGIVVGSISKERLLYPPGDWHYLFDVPAHGEDIYYVVASTLEDSCIYNTTDYYSIFFIRATTAVPTEYYESTIDSGYSVDNLAPGVPEGFMVAYVAGSNELAWNENEAEDFQYFRIYRGESEDFEPSTENLIHMTAGTSWTDTHPDCWRYVYKITALDHAGNESGAAWQTFITDADVPGVPKAFALYQNAPNPFNPTTTIRFDLPRAVHVKLSIYNVKGELISTIVDQHMTEGRKEIAWTAKDSRGRAVTSGIYFYRLVAGDFVQTKKMVLLR